MTILIIIKSIKLKDIIYFDYLGIERDRIVIDKEKYKKNEISDIYGNPAKAKKILNWNYDLNFYDVLNILIKEKLANQNFEAK